MAEETQPQSVSETRAAPEGTALEGSMEGAGDWGAWGDEPEETPDAPTSIGRFVVLAQVGAGSMGVVYAAYDADLDRKVAVKLLKVQGKQKQRRHARLFREAQALAKLSHPNVVQVYEVGMHGDSVFLAMEFLIGNELREWARGEDRAWREVLDKYLQAGRGLEAAHRAGMVHRDFKPENAFVGTDGRVRVLDFGLARATSDFSDTRDVSGSHTDVEDELARLTLDTGSSRPGSLGSPGLTRTGALMGTPAYMSPEQFDRRPADARSDQFSFCVALWESLFGRRPFTGDTAMAIGENVRAGRIRDPPPGIPVPRWLRRALERGLSPNPEDRWPNMGELLSELGRDRGTRVRILAWTGAAAMLTGGVMWGAVGDQSDAIAICEGAEEAMHETWNSEQRARLETAFLATEVSFAAETFARVDDRLDRYAQAWAIGRKAACEATHVRGLQSERLLDLRVTCLENQRESMGALIDALAHVDGAGVERAVEAITRLGVPRRCADRDRLLAKVAPPDDPAVAKQVEEVRRRLRRATAIGEAGRYADAIDLVEGLRVEAESLDYPALRAEVLVAQANLRQQASDPERAAADYAEGFSIALEVGDEETAASAAADAANLFGYVMQRYDEGALWGRVATALAKRQGEDTVYFATALDSVGSLHFRKGEYEVALPLYERALALRIELHGENDPRVASALNNMAAIHHYLGHRELAAEQMTRAVKIAERTLGPNHPDVGLKIQNLGTFATYIADNETARRQYERAYEIAIGGGGEQSHHGAVPLALLGGVDVDEGKLEDGREKLQRALDSLTTIHGDERVDVATPLSHLGRIEGKLGNRARAVEHLERAIAIVKKSVGLDHPFAALPLESLSEVELPHDAKRALELAEQAVKIREARHPGTPHLARARALLARALWANEQQARAREVAEQSARFMAGNERMAGELAVVRGWIAEHSDK